MTKRWSSTRSLDGKTKQEAARAIRRNLAAELRQLEREPAAAKVSSIEELFEYLDGPDEVPKR